ncbi:hypothetical protein D3C87_1168160 [compost metagenome]
MDWPAVVPTKPRAPGVEAEAKVVWEVPPGTRAVAAKASGPEKVPEKATITGEARALSRPRYWRGNWGEE